MKKLTMRQVDEYIVSTLFKGVTETNPVAAARVLLVCGDFTSISRAVLKLLNVPISKTDIANNTVILHDRHFNVVKHIVINHRPIIVVDVPTDGKLYHIDGFNGHVIHSSDHMEHQI